VTFSRYTEKFIEVSVNNTDESFSEFGCQYGVFDNADFTCGLSTV
jgi:hypothetical protein